jgi:hypothetical protein
MEKPVRQGFKNCSLTYHSSAIRRTGRKYLEIAVGGKDEKSKHFDGGDVLDEASR